MTEEPKNKVNDNIMNAMLEFRKNTIEEKDYEELAVGIHCMLISIYQSSAGKEWKERLRSHLNDYLELVKD